MAAYPGRRGRRQPCHLTSPVRPAPRHPPRTEFPAAATVWQGQPVAGRRLRPGPRRPCPSRGTSAVVLPGYTRSGPARLSERSGIRPSWMGAGYRQLAGLALTARVTGALPIPPWASDMPPPQPQMPPGRLGRCPPTSSWGDKSASSAGSPNLPLRPAAPTPASGGPPGLAALPVAPPSRIFAMAATASIGSFDIFFFLSSVSRTLIPRSGHHCGKRACHLAKETENQTLCEIKCFFISRFATASFVRASSYPFTPSRLHLWLALKYSRLTVEIRRSRNWVIRTIILLPCQLSCR